MFGVGGAGEWDVRGWWAHMSRMFGVRVRVRVRVRNSIAGMDGVGECDVRGWWQG